MKKRVIIPTIALIAILGAVTIGTVTVSAQSPMYGNLITQIAQKFNLKESDVQDVVNQVRATQQTTMKTKWQDRLTQAVTDGKITDVQRQAIIAKHNELQTQFTSLQGLSVTDRKAKMAQIQSDLKTWATANGLDSKFLGLIGMRPGFRGGFRLGYWAGNNS